MSPGFEFTLRAMAIGAVCGISCAILGCFLVLRRISLLGDGISHGVLPGLVIGFLVGGRTNPLPLLLFAVGFGLLTAALTHFVSTRGGVSEDASLGIVFTALFALGVLMISSDLFRRIHFDTQCVLGGKLEQTLDDTWPLLGFEIPRMLFTLGPTLVAVLVFVSIVWKELKLSSFDPTLADAMGFSSVVVHYALATMVSWVTVASFEAVGSILVIALLIVPAATAQMLTDRLRSMLVVAAVVATAAAILGVTLGRRWDVSYAGSITVALGGLFLLAVLFAPRHGLLARLLANLGLAMRIGSEDVLATLYRREERTGEVVAASVADCVRIAGEGFVGWLAVRRCLHRNLVDRRPGDDVVLTERGRAQGQAVVRSHRLWEAYLDEHFELPVDHLHEPAERVEHYIGPELRERLAEELATPDVDPHGRAIPGSRGERPS